MRTTILLHLSMALAAPAGVLVGALSAGAPLKFTLALGAGVAAVIAVVYVTTRPR